MSVAILPIEIKEGATLQQVCHDVMELASQVLCNIKFEYEGVTMIVNENMEADFIEKEWCRRKEMVAKTILEGLKDLDKAGEKSLYQHYRDSRGYPDVDQIK